MAKNNFDWDYENSENNGNITERRGAGICVISHINSREPSNVSDFLFILLLSASAITSIVALLVNTPDSPGWIRLYLRRKAIEEQKKIESLQSDSAQPRN